MTEKIYRVKVVDKNGKHVFNLGKMSVKVVSEYYTKSMAEKRARETKKQFPHLTPKVLKKQTRKLSVTKRHKATSFNDLLGW